MVFLKTVFLFILLSSISRASKLNVPRVLLPLFYDFQTNFTLEVTDAGCYNWTPLRPNIVRLQCLDVDPELGCCSRVVVAAANKEFRRNTETILAEDIHSGLVLRCEIIVDVIHSLSIVTTTREIFLDESPEAFEVRAYDEQGNEFTTLEGVELDWSFRTVGAGNKSGESTVVRYMTFAESPYEVPRSIDAFERLGLKGYIILLEGKQTGSAAVSVRLPQPEYSDVAAVGVQLLVLTNLLVIPQDATLLKGDNLRYRLQQFQQGRVTDIKFPSAQYHLTSEDARVHMDSATGIATGVALGKARIVLVDGNVGESDVKPPTATLTVAVPHELSLAVLPSRKWSVIVGQEYDIVAELYDTDRRRFQIGDNAMLSIRLDESYFHVQVRPKNGSFVHGIPTRVGRIEVVGELLGVKDPLGSISRSSHLIVASDLHIYEPIRITPSEVLIPWDPTAKARYEVPLTATGGDGTYTWSSLKSAVAVVNQRGVVKTLEEGITTVVAAMTLNPTIRGISTVRVLPPVGLDILDTPLEAEVGTSIPLHIVLYGEIDGKRVPFTLCDAVPFEATFSDINFERITVTKFDSPTMSCGTIFVTGKTPGATQVTIKYGQLHASAIVAAHKPLVQFNPSSGTTLLSVGTSRLIVFTGGPRSWALKPSENHHSLNNPDIDEDLIKVVEQNPSSIQKDFYVYRVSCRQLSETTLTLKVTNKVVGSSSTPALSTASITIICAKPKFLQLSPVVKNIAKCPLHAEDVVALSYKNLELDVAVKDARGRRFDNITSLELKWILSKTSLAKIIEPLREVTVEEESFSFPAAFIQSFVTLGGVGIVEVEGRITGYDGEVLFSQSIVPESPPFPELIPGGGYQTPDIRSSLTITLVNATIATPNKTEIFAGDGDEREINVLRGSGHFEVTTNTTGIVSVEKEGRILRLKALEVGSVIVEISDVCLDTDPVAVFVQVYRIGDINLEVLEYVERGKAVEARVTFFDEDGDRLTSLPSASVLHLTPITGSDIITVKPEESSASEGEFFFNVRGVTLGETTLSISAGDIISRSVPISVFPALKLSPRNITLLVSSSFQVLTSDGPPSAHLEFSIDDGLTAKVSLEGIVEGVHVGECSLTAKAIVIQRETGQKFVVSQDRVDIRVVPLKGVTIHAPITSIVSGGKMPLWAIGPPGKTSVLRLGSTSVTTRFRWSLSQEACAEIQTVFHDLGLEVPENEKVVMRFLAIKPGRVIVTLTARIPGSIAGTSQAVEYTDSITIEVMPSVTLLSPRPMVMDYLLMSPSAITEIRTTRQIRRHEVTILSGGPKIVQVSADGSLISGDSTGVAVIAFGPIEKPWRHLIVYVKPIEYIMLNLVPRWKLRASERLSVIPNGLDLEVNVSFHDEEGNQFDAVRSNIVASYDQKGIVNIARGSENGSLVLNVLESGSALVRVRDVRSRNQPADYLPIHSSDVLFPTNARISVGDVICLRMPVFTGEDLTSAWSVDNAAKLRLWQEAGIAVACGQPGVTTVYHQASPRLRSRIEVFPIQKIELLPHDTMLTTASNAVTEYPLVLSAIGEKDKQRNLLAFNRTCGPAAPKDFTPSCFPFICKLSFNNPVASSDIQTLFNVAPSYNLDTGLFSCRVQCIAKPSASTATLSETIVLQVLSEDGSTESRANLIPFTPALFVQQSQLKVTYSKPRDHITVYGLKHVFEQLKIVTDKHLVSVSLAEESETSRTYSVSVDAAWWSLEDPPVLSAILWSKLTNQKIQVIIRCSGLRVPAADDSFSHLQLIIYLTIAIASALAVYYWTSTRNGLAIAGPVQTCESPFLRTPTLEETILSHNHPRSPSRGSPEYSLNRPFDDYPVYGSPWRLGRGAERRERSTWSSS